ncbi:hypothetical protein EPA93_08800 [Ktedonosporobacter rubrisoli]|uniref:Uncharacterized protein n=1 Tax=Ktedonosporobacter rubrisoli TaxID=2509675 RepID=A0A4V0YYG1_KTERU|nr:hypothetical protein [Ktedonosporobacter rubrisoli]QBD76101.1 hypothetical protein EPA93_08800 [Ktedonosporobacter rubrisoli]
MFYATFAALAIWLAWHWSQTNGWSGLHRLALASGALMAHTVFGIFALTYNIINKIGFLVLGLIMPGLLLLFTTQIQARIRAKQKTPALNPDS